MIGTLNVCIFEEMVKGKAENGSCDVSVVGGVWWFCGDTGGAWEERREEAE